MWGCSSITQGFVDHAGFYSNYNTKPLEDFEQRTGMV